MATLATGQNKLTEFDRRRQLAAALTQQAVSTNPIVHQAQGWAKIAQALAANRLQKGADKDEDAYNEKRRKALVEALSPTSTYSQLPDSQVTLEGIEGAFEPETMNVPGRRFMGARNKTPVETLQGLPTDLAEEVTGNVLQQQLMAQAGVTPQQLSNADKVRDAVNFGTPDGVVMMTAVPGTPEFDAAVDDPRLVRIGPASQVQKTQEVSPLSASDLSKLQEGFTTGIVALDDLGRLKSNIMRGGMTGQTVVGGARGLLDNFEATFKATGQTFSRQGEGLWLDRNSYKDFIVSEGDKKKYSPEEIRLNKRFHKRFSALDSENQEIAISLAYLLARIADPGGRLSEMDVLNQMRALQLDQPDPTRRLAAIASAERRFALRMQTQLQFARSRSPDVFVPPDFEGKLNAILSRQSGDFGLPTETNTSPPTVTAPEQVQADAFIQKIVDGKATPAEEMRFIRDYPGLARQYGLIQ